MSRTSRNKLWTPKFTRQNTTQHEFASLSRFLQKRNNCNSYGVAKCVPLMYQCAKQNLTLLLLAPLLHGCINKQNYIFLRKERKTDMGDHRVRQAYFPFASYIYSYSVSPPLKPSKWPRCSQVPQRVEFQPRLPVQEMNLEYRPASSQDIVLNVNVKLIRKTKPARTDHFRYVTILLCLRAQNMHCNRASKYPWLWCPLFLLLDARERLAVSK
jgi:hypothetical protein